VSTAIALVLGVTAWRQLRLLALLLGERVVRDALLRGGAIRRSLRLPLAERLVDGFALVFGLFLVVEVRIRRRVHHDSTSARERGKADAGERPREKLLAPAWFVICISPTLMSKGSLVLHLSRPSTLQAGHEALSG